MQKVNRDFDFYKKIEIILMAAGLVLFFYSATGTAHGWAREPGC